MALEYELKFLKLDIGIKPIPRKDFKEDIQVLGGCTYLVTETITKIDTDLLKQAKANAEGFVTEYIPNNYSIQLNL